MNKTATVVEKSDATQRPAQRMTYEEFLDWADEDTYAESRRADFFVLDSEGCSQRALPDTDGKCLSAVLPGFWVNVNWLWQSPLPSVRSVLKDWEAAG